MTFDVNTGSVIVEDQKDLEKLYHQYQVKTEKELDDYLWYTYGISLINKINKTTYEITC